RRAGYQAMKQRNLMGVKLFTVALLLGGVLVCTGRGQGQTGDEKLPPGAKVVKIEAEPASIQLTNPLDYTQLLLRGFLENGDVIDLTRVAKLEKPSEIASVSERGQVRPVKDGDGALTFAFQGKTVSVPVAVTNQSQKYQVNFVRDVMPILSKAGCNAG